MDVTEEAKQPTGAAGPAPMPWWVFALALGLTALPFLFTTGVPSWDYSMHAARASISVRHELPLFRDIFRYHLVPLPNLAVDLVVPLLATFLPLTVANKLFVLAALLLQATGAAALTVAIHRRLTTISLLIPVACYSIVLGWGFTGYLFTLGVAMWGFASYIMLRPKNVPVRATVLALFAITTYFGHLAAFGLLMVSIAIYEVVLYLGPESRNRAEMRSWLVVSALASILPILVHLSLSKVGQSSGVAFAPPVLWVTDLIMALNPYRTIGLSIWTLVLAGALTVLIRKRAVAIHAQLGWTALLLLGVFLLTPMQLYGSWYANTRLIPWVLFVFLAALSNVRVGTGAARAIGAVCVMFLLAQTLMIRQLWSGWDDDRKELMAGVRKAPQGTMFVSLEQSGPIPARRNFLQSVGRSLLQDDKDWHPPTSHITDEVAMEGEYFPAQHTLLPGKQPTEIDPKYADIYIRINSSFLNSIAQRTAASFAAASEQERKRLYSDIFSFTPLQVNFRTHVAVHTLLIFADSEYRRIRRESGVYPTAGTFVVYIHRWSAAPNPFPDLLRPVSIGRLYDVYEVVSTAPR